ncbi:hypothetical protein L1D55_27230 [Vibrio sp. Isolate22]|uniref:hypothetical protein n=1 Tax=Vibrio sp. Isolate22 TaxID=2908532 RepID=UPI001EFE13EA|nr:hypothetical protein [Vibrio sp. Isolate22]MCG9695311.1 hypothetical protein [Vibrio sp. Isolate22]
MKKITGGVRQSLPNNVLDEIIPLINELRNTFSTLELSRLCLINDLFDNGGELLVEALSKYKETSLTGAAYHSSHECRELNKNFLDLSWDQEDREKVKRLEVELTKIYENILYGEVSDSEVSLVIPNELKSEYGAEDAKVTLRKNSGHLIFSNPSKEDIIDQLKLVLLDAETFRNSSDDIKEQIGKFTYGTDRWGVVKDNDTMKEWKKYKDKIADLVITYFRISSPNQISSNLLDSLNLRPCRTCRKQF